LRLTIILSRWIVREFSSARLEARLYGRQDACRYNRDVLDCGGKRSATPLSHGRKIFKFTARRVRSKAPSPLPPSFHFGAASPLCRRSP